MPGIGLENGWDNGCHNNNNFHEYIGWQTNHSSTPFMLGKWQDPTCQKRFREGNISFYRIDSTGEPVYFDDTKYYDNVDWMVDKLVEDYPFLEIVKSIKYMNYVNQFYGLLGWVRFFLEFNDLLDEVSREEGRTHNIVFDNTDRVILWKGDYGRTPFGRIHTTPGPVGDIIDIVDPNNGYTHDTSDASNDGWFNGAEIGFYKFKRTEADLYLGGYYREELTAMQFVLVHEETNEIIVQASSKNEYWLSRWCNKSTKHRVGWDYDKLTLYFRVKAFWNDQWMRWKDFDDVAPYAPANP